MAINRAPFNALVDDDGSGTKGSPWNKAAIQGVILDPVDAAVAAAASPLVLLGSASGAETTATGTSFSYIAIPQLTMNDSLVIALLATNASAAAMTLNLAWYDPATTNIVPAIDLTGPTGAGTYAGGSVFYGRAQARVLPPGPANIETTCSASLTAGTAQSGPGATFARLSTANFLTAGPGYLYWQHVGVPAGGFLYWSWSVHLLKG